MIFSGKTGDANNVDVGFEGFIGPISFIFFTSKKCSGLAVFSYCYVYNYVRNESYII